MNTTILKRTTTLAVALTALLVLAKLYLNASLLIFAFVFLVITMCVLWYMNYRNNWICDARIKLIPTDNYDRLISYDEMFYNHIFTYDLSKMMKN